MSSYKRTLDDGRKPISPLGRVSLAYRTVDGEEAGSGMPAESVGSR
jgi:hypothetical protein